MSKLVAVVGATGKQGGGVVRSILDDPEAKSQFSLRGLTRDPNSGKAKALSAEGVECVAADIGDYKTLEAAFKGAYAVFAVTDFWASMKKDVEVQQGKNIVDACKANGVKQLILSTLEDVAKVSKGKYVHVDHFDGKAEIDEYAASVGVPTVYFMPGFYMSNMTDSMLRHDAESNTYKIKFPVSPDAKFPVFDAASDTGKFVKAILLHGESMNGRRVRAASEFVTAAGIIEAFKRAYPVSGKGAEFVQVPAEGFQKGLEAAGMPPSIQVELCEMFEFIGEFGYYGKEGIDDALALLKEKPTSLEAFFKAAPAYKDLK